MPGCSMYLVHIPIWSLYRILYRLILMLIDTDTYIGGMRSTIYGYIGLQTYNRHRYIVCIPSWCISISDPSPISSYSAAAPPSTEKKSFDSPRINIQINKWGPDQNRMISSRESDQQKQDENEMSRQRPKPKTLRASYFLGGPSGCWEKICQ
jgi:hypothetical protein